MTHEYFNVRSARLACFSRKTIYALGMATAVMAILPTAASAQSAPTSGTKLKKSTGIETVVVTAEKRRENIRNVAATISAVTASQLEAVGPVTSTGDLLQSIPGVRFNDLESPNLSEISIRGSGTERATGADSGVGLFVNGAYVGSSTLGGRNFRNVDFFDLKRVEVLEGPQGALYGRNAEYGVVNIVLAKPEFRDSGRVSETYTAGLSQNKISLILNQKLSDHVAVRFGGESIGQSSGFYYNPDNGKYYDQTNGWIARGQIRYRRGPLDVDFLLDAQNLDLPTFVNDYVAPPGFYPTLPLGFVTNRFTAPHAGKDSVNQQEHRAMILANYNFGWGILTSTTMASDWTSVQNFNASAIDLATEAQLQAKGEIGIYPFSQVRTDVRDRTLYEDLHLAGSAFNDRLMWLVGGEFLYQKDRSTISTATSPCPLRVGSGVCGGTPTTPLCYLLLSNSTPCSKPFPFTFGSYSVEPQQYDSEAIYGSAKYELGDGFAVDGQFRYSADHKTATLNDYILYTNTLAQPSSSYTFDGQRPSYTLTLSYLIPRSWHDLVYAKMGTGYRAGGVNNGFAVPGAPGASFSPTYGNEDTTSYEVGIKGDIGSSVYATLDAYYSRTGNAITSVADGCTITNVCGRAQTLFNINAGTVHAKGIEASVSSRLELWGGSLTLQANGSNQSATYVELPPGIPGLPVLDSLVAQIPHWIASANLGYAHSITGNSDAFVNLSYHAQWGGGQDAVTKTIPFNELSTINNLDVRAGVDYRQFELAFFVQNLTNEQVALLKFEELGVPLASRFNEPRTYGVNLTYRW